jgi:hypothetical protein
MKEKTISNLPESLVQTLMKMGISKKLISQIAANAKVDLSEEDQRAMEPSTTVKGALEQVDADELLGEQPRTGGQPEKPQQKAMGGLMKMAETNGFAGTPDSRRMQGYAVGGAGGGQDDLIPALLADGEYVMDADIVAALGDGSSKEGAAKLDKMREAIRKHKRAAPVNKIPPKAKSPLAYLKESAR